MEYNELMQHLKSHGSEKTRKTYKRHGVDGEQFGVSYAVTGLLKKKIKIDHELAIKLWSSRNHDARVLATMIADPAKLDAALLDEWVKDVHNYVINDALTTLAIQTITDSAKIEKWMKSSDEWTACFGWSLLARTVRVNNELADDTLEKYLEIIERDIHGSANRVRHSMNSAVIAIGVRNEKLQKKAMASAARIGKVQVDHGETDCQTPDAAQYILKTVSHKSIKHAK